MEDFDPKEIEKEMEFERLKPDLEPVVKKENAENWDKRLAAAKKEAALKQMGEVIEMETADKDREDKHEQDGHEQVA